MPNNHGGGIGDGPIEKHQLEQMNLLATWLDQKFNAEKAGKADSEWGFILMVFRFGDQQARCNYISNAHRDDVVRLLEAQLRKFRKQQRKQRRTS